MMVTGTALICMQTLNDSHWHRIDLRLNLNAGHWRGLKSRKPRMFVDDDKGR